MKIKKSNILLLFTRLEEWFLVMDNDSEKTPFSLKELNQGILELYKNTGVKESIESAKEMQEILEPIKMIKELFEIWNFILRRKKMVMVEIQILSKTINGIISYFN